MKTPGVYIVEKSAFPNSVVEAATAVPAFIGITEKAQNGPDSLLNKPWKITSMTEFHHYFGGAMTPQFVLSVEDAPQEDAADNADSQGNGALYGLPSLNGDKMLTVREQGIRFSLYYQMIMFYANGGGTCYIVSVGTYDGGKQIDKSNVETAMNALAKEQEVTMVVVPEAAFADDCKDIQTRMLKHCGEMMNRFAILDVQTRATAGDTVAGQIETFRENIGSNYLSYGAAYYPWLRTSVLSDKDIDSTVLTWDFTGEAPDLHPFVPADSKLPDYFTELYTGISQAATASPAGEGAQPAATAEDVEVMKANLHNVMLRNFPGYQCIVNKVRDSLNMLPPSAAIAGLYTMVDNTRGVWKAPANVSLNYVDGLTENIDNAMQEELNMPMNGKAVNAIRVFSGEGIKVWGARTLDGNSQDWRYVNVRRTMIFLEESVRNAAKAYVFEPNVAATWMNVRSMIDGFMRSVWQRGGLAGATPEDAYEIHVGLGDTMTSDDILDGIMRVSVLVAVTRPAEFIEITFQQQMQKN